MVAATTPMEAHCWAHLRLHIPCTDLGLLTFWSKRWYSLAFGRRVSLDFFPSRTKAIIWGKEKEND